MFTIYFNFVLIIRNLIYDVGVDCIQSVKFNVSPDLYLFKIIRKGLVIKNNTAKNNIIDKDIKKMRHLFSADS